MKIKLLLFTAIVLLIVPQLVIAATQDLTYDSPTNQVNITYDSLNRISTKNSTNVNITYTYDEQYQGTLTNVTFGNDTIKYEYDDRLRLIKEIRIIDGIQFEKRFVYDSMDRLVEINMTGQEVEYYYNNQSKINKITNYVTSAFYDAFDKLLNRTYSNTRVTEQTYNDSNSRLAQIKTDTIQGLNYSYDSVGNVILINDTANSRAHRAAYDFLDRLVNVSIGGNTWLYAYNSIGNILKIVRDSVNTTKFVYGTYPTHAPSQIVTVDAGIDVHKPENLYSSSRNRAIQFYLANEKNSTITNVNWTVDFADGTVISSTEAFNIPNEPILVVVEHNYSSGGNYDVNVTARSNAASYDFENVTNKFGITIGSLSFISQSGSRANFNITINNGLNFTVSSIDWACDNGAKSNSSFSIAGLSSRVEYFNRTYSPPGVKYLNCNVTSPEGNDTKFAKFELKGIKIEDFNSSSVAESNRSVQFTIKNFWSPTAVSWDIRSDGQLLPGTTVNLATGNSETISQTINYTSDGIKSVNVTIYSGNLVDLYNETFVLKALRVEDYDSSNNTGNNRLLKFHIKNYWPQNLTNVSWNITDPILTSNNAFNLAEGESVFVFIEHNYTTQGIKKPTITAYNGTFSSNFVDRFAVKMIGVLRNLALVEGKDNVVQVIEVINNIGNQVASWLFNTGQETIGSTQNVSLNNSEQVFIIIETNYTIPGVYSPNITVNTTSYNDTSTGVVVT